MRAGHRDDPSNRHSYNIARLPDHQPVELRQ